MAQRKPIVFLDDNTLGEIPGEDWLRPDPAPEGTLDIFLNATSGSDANDGLTPLGAVATFERALEVLQGQRPMTVSFNFAPGEYGYVEFNQSVVAPQVFVSCDTGAIFEGIAIYGQPLDTTLFTQLTGNVEITGSFGIGTGGSAQILGELLLTGVDSALYGTTFNVFSATQVSVVLGTVRITGTHESGIFYADSNSMVSISSLTFDDTGGPVAVGATGNVFNVSGSVTTLNFAGVTGEITGARYSVDGGTLICTELAEVDFPGDTPGTLERGGRVIDMNWAPPIIDAPQDGAIYGRQNGEWVILVPAPSLPEMLTAPVVTGATFVGDTATTTNGTWSGGTIIEYEYRWQVDDSGYVDVSGETANTYTNVPLGTYRSGVRARNDIGWSDWAYSDSFSIVEEPTGLVWAEGFRTSRVENVATCTGGTGEFCHAWTDPLPTGKYYIEIELSDPTDGDGRAGAWCPPDTTDPGIWGPLGQYFSRQSFGATGGEWTNQAYANGDYIDGGSPNTSLDPVRRFALSIDTVARELWARQQWVDGQSAWWGNGDPVAGTDAALVFGGIDAICVAMSGVDGMVATIVPAANHYGTAPSGFTAI